MRDNTQAPLVVGVTGHLDIRPTDVRDLTDKIIAVFRELRSSYPATPLVLLSSLAEGADRLVAKVALSREFNARLIVALPMPLSMYEEDFKENPGSLEEFHRLYDRRADSVLMPLLDAAELIQAPGPPRDRQYEAVGRYLAQQSQILLALWNGLDRGLVGGTASVVRFQIHGVPETGERQLQPPELFPVYQIVTPRVRESATDGEPFSLRIRYPVGFRDDREAERYYRKLFRNLDEFNEQVARADEELREEMARSREGLLGTIDAADLRPEQHRTLERFAHADALAIEFRKRVVDANASLHWMIFWAFAAFVFFAHYPWGGHPMPALATAAGLLIWGYFERRVDARFGLDAKSQDYRAMAEGLRVKFFWQLAGIDDSVADYYLGKQRTELDWIRTALRAWDQGGSTQRRSIYPSEIKSVLKNWVLAQHAYYRSAARRDSEQSEQYEIWVRTALWLMVLTGAGVLIALMWNREVRCLDCEWLSWPIIVIDLLLAAGALLHHFAGRMAFVEHAKQYKRMESVFNQAFKAVRDYLHSDDARGVQDCFHGLGKEALAENGDWVMLHRERPLELPHP